MQSTLKLTVSLFSLLFSLFGMSQTSVSSAMIVAHKANGKEKLFEEGNAVICYYKDAQGDEVKIRGRYCKWGDDQIQFRNEILEMESIVKIRKDRWYLKLIAIPFLLNAVSGGEAIVNKEVDAQAIAVMTAYSAIGGVLLFGGPRWCYNPHYVGANQQ